MRKIGVNNITISQMIRSRITSQFTNALSREFITLVARQNKEGNIYGLTYVDVKNKCMFNGSDLGKEFSAKGILERFIINRHQLY